jgi:hypothetical protein
LLDRSIAAMVAAIDIYNKPDFRYRTESFTVLAINAWELMLKAKWLDDHNNQMSSLYVRYSKGQKRKFIKRGRSGNPITHSLDYLAKKLLETGTLDQHAWKNLQILLEMRDTIVHFYHKSPRFAERLQEVGAACVKNFVTAVQDWFNYDLSKYNVYLMPLSFVSIHEETQAVLLNKEEKNVNGHLKIRTFGH